MSKFSGALFVIFGFAWLINAVFAFKGELPIVGQVVACVAICVWFVALGLRHWRGDLT